MQEKSWSILDGMRIMVKLSRCAAKNLLLVLKLFQSAYKARELKKFASTKISGSKLAVAYHQRQMDRLFLYSSSKPNVSSYEYFKN